MLLYGSEDIIQEGPVIHVWAAIYTDFLNCWLSHSHSFGKQCKGKQKGYITAISTLHHLKKGLHKVRVRLRFPAAACTDSNATLHTMWNHMKKTKTKNKEAFAQHKSSTTLFAMMDYITGLTGMSIMDIWWSSEWMGTVESRVISHYVLKTCYVLENSLRWEWNGEETSCFLVFSWG